MDERASISQCRSLSTIRALLAVAVAGRCHRSFSGLRRTTTQNLTSGSGNAAQARCPKAQGRTTAQGVFGLIDRQAVSKYSTAVGRSPAFTERTPDGVLYENLTLDVLNMPHRICGSSWIAGLVETQTSPMLAFQVAPPR
jgi:hypothetical protein